MSIRVSVSDIETYRYYKSHEDVTLADCLAQLRRQRPASPSMLAGSALHRFLETAECDGREMPSVKSGEYRFYFRCDVDIAIPPIRELKGELEIETPAGLVTLVGVVDAMDTAVSDYKLTGNFDAERFAESYQWRCYLMMFGASRFLYRVFVGKEESEGSGFDGERFIDWTITEYHELPVYRYPGMEEDVLREVSEFAAFSRQYLTAAA